MTPPPSFASRAAHGDWVRLDTLILLRWSAIIGQTGAILAAWLHYKIALDVGLALLTVGASVAANLVAIFLFPRVKRLSEAETLAMLLFDVAQLALLLALSGGLDNPFALLIIVPVTIAATALNIRSTIFVGGATLGMVTLLALIAPGLRFTDGTALAIPELFHFGIWLAIVIGVVFLALYAHRVASEAHTMGEALLATQLALAREQKLTDLGGVVAALAHELGTPLATIKLVSAEMADELTGDAREDALLIREQANRCRDILHSMGRAGKDDLHLRAAPLEAVLREAAEPHLERGKRVVFVLAAEEGGAARAPQIRRAPELIHALRNLVQNAVDFAQEEVRVEAGWTGSRLFLRVRDDGAGYPTAILGRIGDPFLGERRADPRAGYEGMGLGLFIAKTLLERTGGRVNFRNSEPSEGGHGAVAEVVWPLARLEVQLQGGLGENQLNL